MKLRLDKFTIVVLAVVAVLLVAAVITVSRSQGQANQGYRTDDAPATPVINAFLALQKGDLATARQQYSKQALAAADKNEANSPLRGQPYYGDTARRLRLVETRVDPKDPNRAYVSVAIDNYSTGGLFSSGSTNSNDRMIEAVREDGTWKINVEEYFY